jgi:Methyltransferase domain
MNAPVIYQHPLAYLLGLEGIALLLALSGAYDRDFTLTRFREIQALLDSADLQSVPLGDDSVDLVVCAIALSHVPDLTPVLESSCVSSDRTGTW